MQHTNWLWLPVAAITTSAYAATYFTVEQAQQAIFPSGKFVETSLALSAQQKKEIETRTGVRVSHDQVRAWKVEGGGYFLIDEVLGKHEFITYALGLNADGSVKQIEIMQYNESYGYQVRNPEWRKQFVNKTVASPLKLDEDIKNISGATLSTKHIADGVKRMLATYEVALK